MALTDRVNGCDTDDTLPEVRGVTHMLYQISSVVVLLLLLLLLLMLQLLTWQCWTDQVTQRA